MNHFELRKETIRERGKQCFRSIVCHAFSSTDRKTQSRDPYASTVEPDEGRFTRYVITKQIKFFEIEQAKFQRRPHL